MFGGRLTAFVHNAGLNVAWGTTSAPEAPANLEPDEDWNDRIYGAHVSLSLTDDLPVFLASQACIWHW